MADISKITLPSGTTYDIKDARARELIGSLSGALTYLGNIKINPKTGRSL